MRAVGYDTAVMVLAGVAMDMPEWFAHRADGTEIADSHRYRMCGNGVVAPVAEWIGRRIVRAVENTERRTITPT